jgi:exo-1,4-beta-D-glucosaminidase
VVVNDQPQAFRGLKVSAELLNLDLARKFSQEATLDVAADGVARAFVVPKPKDLSTTHFLKLGLRDADGRTVSTNFYWLSTREDVLDWKKTQWYYTPTRVHADLRALASLPATTLAVTAGVEPAGPEGKARVTVRNTGGALAFQVRLKLKATAEGDEILPVYWDDNYFALMPGEVKEVEVAYPATGAGAPGPVVVEAEAWNAPSIRAEGSR